MKVQALVAGLVLALANVLPASAQTNVYSTSLFGSLENPPNASPAAGAAVVTFDMGTLMMRVQAGFNGLGSGSTVAHIHCCIPPPGNVGVATATPTFPGFPVGQTFGFYDQTFDMTSAGSYNAAFITANGNIVGARNALVAGLNAGSAYFNLHSTNFPNGEIRGFLQPIPEPETYAMMLAGLALVGWMAARRRGFGPRG